MHIHSTSINIYCQKFEIQTHFIKIHMKMTNLGAYALEDKFLEILSCSAYVAEICFVMIFSRCSLNLKFFDSI